MSGRGPARAFTITELVVSVAIVAILLGMLMPSLSGVRASARSAECVSNLRQMSTAAQGYALQYGYYPPAIRYDLKDGEVLQYAWDWVTTMSNRLVSPGALWSFTDDPDRVQRCPSCRSATNFAADPFTGYNYNTTRVGGEGKFMNWGWQNFRAGTRMSACRRPATTAAFGDGAEVGGIANKFMRAPMNMSGEAVNLQTIYNGTQAFRHMKATNVAYLDLHVAASWTPHRGAHATAALLDLMRYPENGFLSDDDRAYDPR